MQPLLNCEKLQIRSCFNRAATTYDAHSALQFSVGCQLINLLENHYEKDKTLLDLGCGTGKLTLEINQRLSVNKIVAIDIAENLLYNAKKIIFDIPAKLLQADFDSIPINNNTIDNVFSNMALQWSLDLKIALKEISRILLPEGILAFSIPGHRTFFELLASQKHFNPQITMNKFITINNLFKLLYDLGFNILATQTTNHVLYFKNLLELMRSIKKSGTNFSPHKTYGSKLYLRQLEQFYFSTFGTRDDQLPLTYSIFSIIAQKR